MFVNSRRFVCFPAVGTLDEYFESCAIQRQASTSPSCSSVRSEAFIGWMHDTMLQGFHNIDEVDMKQFILTDDVEQAAEHIAASWDRMQKAAAAEPAAETDVRKAPWAMMTAEGTRVGLPPRKHKRPGVPNGNG